MVGTPYYAALCLAVFIVFDWCAISSSKSLVCLLEKHLHSITIHTLSREGKQPRCHKAVWSVKDFLSWPSPKSSDRPFQPISCKSLSCHVGLTFWTSLGDRGESFGGGYLQIVHFCVPPFHRQNRGGLEVPWNGLGKWLWMLVLSKEKFVHLRRPGTCSSPFQWLKVSVCRCKRPSWRIWSRFLMLMQAALLHRQSLPNSRNVHIEF